MHEVSIKSKKLEVPVVQGGMGIGVSRCRLAGAVAAEGGMGVISTAQVGYDEPDFRKNPEKANLRALPQQIAKAKSLSAGKGMIGVNIMAVTQLYEEYVKTVCEAGVDAIISGAGLPTNLPEYAKGYDVALAPIVSSAKSAKVILKYWEKKYSRTADFLVIEGPKAGGHLGFSREALVQGDFLDYDEEICRILKVKEAFEEKFGVKIPVFVAGGIFDAEDVKHMLELGADGVQVASRFVATRECDASDAYKQAYVDASEDDIVIIDSPVGMPGRALRNRFIKEITGTSEKITFCFNCLKACNPASAHYCITKALIQAVRGNLDEGLIFCGARVGEIHKISTVAEVIRELFDGENLRTAITE